MLTTETVQKLKTAQRTVERKLLAICSAHVRGRINRYSSWIWKEDEKLFTKAN